VILHDQTSDSEASRPPITDYAEDAKHHRGKNGTRTVQRARHDGMVNA